MQTGKRHTSPATLAHPKLETLPEGTELWHVHATSYRATSFNPNSENRFAARSTSPPKAMYYAGETAEVAIWETILRDVIADVDGCAAIYNRQLDGRRLARVQTTKDIPLLDLSMPRLRLHVGRNSELKKWQELQQTSDYRETHRAADALLSKVPTIGALKWISKQAGIGAAFVFFAPPVRASNFRILEKQSLEDSKKWDWIDRALALATIKRIETDPKVLRRLR